MSTRHEKYFDELEALCLSQEKNYRTRVSAIVVLNNRIVGYGKNERKSSPFQKRFADQKDTIYSHAEISAIKNSLRKISVSDLERSTMYVLRMKQNSVNNYVRGVAKPCERGCQRAIKQFGIRRVFYTTENGYEEL